MESIGEFALLQLTLAALRVAQGDSSVAAAVTDHLASSLFLRVYFGRAGGRSSQRRGSGTPAFIFCFSSEEMSRCVAGCLGTIALTPGVRIHVQIDLHMDARSIGSVGPCSGRALRASSHVR